MSLSDDFYLETASCACCGYTTIEEYIHYCHICEKDFCDSCYATGEAVCWCCFISNENRIDRNEDHLSHDKMLCEHCLQCSDQPAQARISGWFMRNCAENNSMRTTQYVDFPEGRAQLKWWRVQGQLIVKTVELLEHHRGKGFFTQLCRSLMQAHADIASVKLESVLDDTLIEKLQLMGWKKEPYRNDLIMSR